MRKKHFITFASLLLIGLLISGTACRSKKKILPRVDISAIERDNAEKLEAVKMAQVNFNTLAFKAKADIRIDGKDNEVTINCRMANDQKIWFSVTALAGLEVARMLITTDSVHILNRLESIYLKKPISFIHQYSNPQINFRTLQAILVGNVLDEILNQKPLFSTEQSGLVLTGQSAELAYQLKFNEALRPAELFLQDTLASQQLKIQYLDYVLTEGLWIPHQLKIKSAAAKKSIHIDLKYNKVEKDLELDFPFSVPKRYSVKN
jgi:hypothetical protein